MPELVTVVVDTGVVLEMKLDDTVVVSAELEGLRLLARLDRPKPPWSSRTSQGRHVYGRSRQRVGIETSYVCGPAAACPCQRRCVRSLIQQSVDLAGTWRYAELKEAFFRKQTS